LSCQGSLKTEGVVNRPVEF